MGRDGATVAAVEPTAGAPDAECAALRHRNYSGSAVQRLREYRRQLLPRDTAVYRAVARQARACADTAAVLLEWRALSRRAVGVAQRIAARARWQMDVMATQVSAGWRRR